MKTEDMQRLLVEVTNGATPPEDEDAETAAVRAQLEREVEAILALGGIVDVPPEVP